MFVGGGGGVAAPPFRQEHRSRSRSRRNRSHSRGRLDHASSIHPHSISPSHPNTLTWTQVVVEVLLPQPFVESAKDEVAVVAA